MADDHEDTGGGSTATNLQQNLSDEDIFLNFREVAQDNNANMWNSEGSAGYLTPCSPAIEDHSLTGPTEGFPGVWIKDPIKLRSLRIGASASYLGIRDKTDWTNVLYHEEVYSLSRIYNIMVLENFQIQFTKQNAKPAQGNHSLLFEVAEEASRHPSWIETMQDRSVDLEERFPLGYEDLPSGVEPAGDKAAYELYWWNTVAFICRLYSITMGRFSREWSPAIRGCGLMSTENWWRHLVLLRSFPRKNKTGDGFAKYSDAIKGKRSYNVDFVANNWHPLPGVSERAIATGATGKSLNLQKHNSLKVMHHPSLYQEFKLAKFPGFSADDVYSKDDSIVVKDGSSNPNAKNYRSPMNEDDYEDVYNWCNGRTVVESSGALATKRAQDQDVDLEMPDASLEEELEKLRHRATWVNAAVEERIVDQQIGEIVRRKKAGPSKGKGKQRRKNQDSDDDSESGESDEDGSQLSENENEDFDGNSEQDDQDTKKLIKGMASEVHRQQNYTWEKSCEILGWDPSRPAPSENCLPATTHQVLGLARSVYMDYSPLRWHIQGFQAGLGKTGFMLYHRYIMQRYAVNENLPGKNDPTLVFAPQSVYGNWADDAIKLLKDAPEGLTAITWYNTRLKDTKVPNFAKYRNLKKWYDKLPNNESRGRYIVITTYQTFVQQCAEVDQNARNTRLSARRQRVQERDQEGSTTRVADYLPSEVTVKFDIPVHTLIIDEGQKAKNPRSLTNAAIVSLCKQGKVRRFWNVTATPMDNNVDNILGYTAMMKPFLQDLGIEQAIKDRGGSLNIQDYERFVDLWDAHQTAEEVEQHLEENTPDDHLAFLDPVGNTYAEKYGYFLLDHDQVSKIFKDDKNRTKDGMLKPSVSRAVVGAITRLTTIRTNANTEMQRTYYDVDEVTGALTNPRTVVETPGDTIAKGITRTVDLAPGHRQHQFNGDYLYPLHSHRIIKSNDDDQEETEAKIDAGIERALITGIFHPMIPTDGYSLAQTRMVRRPKEMRQLTSKELQDSTFDDQAEPNDVFMLPGEAKSHDDVWATWTFRRWSRDPNAEVPKSRVELLKFMLKDSAKLRYLVMRLIEIHREGERVVIFVRYPAEQLVVETISALLGFKQISMKRADSGSFRHEKVRAFGTQPGINNFVTMGTVGSAGINLQHKCTNLIILSLPANFNTIEQMKGRINRVGQQRETLTEILTLNHSIDVHYQGHIARKAIPIVSAEVEHERSTVDDSTFNNDNMLVSVAERYIQQALGQPNSRRLWKLEGNDFTKEYTSGQRDRIQDKTDKRFQDAHAKFCARANEFAHEPEQLATLDLLGVLDEVTTNRAKAHLQRSKDLALKKKRDHEREIQELRQEVEATRSSLPGTPSTARTLKAGRDKASKSDEVGDSSPVQASSQATPTRARPFAGISRGRTGVPILKSSQPRQSSPLLPLSTPTPASFEQDSSTASGTQAASKKRKSNAGQESQKGAKKQRTEAQSGEDNDDEDPEVIVAHSRGGVDRGGRGGVVGRGDGTRGGVDRGRGVGVGRGGGVGRGDGTRGGVDRGGGGGVGRGDGTRGVGGRGRVGRGGGVGRGGAALEVVARGGSAQNAGRTTRSRAKKQPISAQYVADEDIADDVAGESTVVEPEKESLDPESDEGPKDDEDDDQSSEEEPEGEAKEEPEDFDMSSELSPPPESEPESEQ